MFANSAINNFYGKEYVVFKFEKKKKEMLKKQLFISVEFHNLLDEVTFVPNA